MRFDGGIGGPPAPTVRRTVGMLLQSMSSRASHGRNSPGSSGGKRVFAEYAIEQLMF